MHRIDWIKSKVSLGDTILEVGSAENPVWAGTPFKVTTLDKSVRPEEQCFPDVVGEAENLPFDDGYFDVICLGELLEHVPVPQQVLKEAVRVARKKVIITVPLEHEWPPELKPFCNLSHIRFYDKATFEKELKQIGLPFTIERIQHGPWVWLGAEAYKLETIPGEKIEMDMQGSFPLFKAEDKVIELGGGDYPSYRPNVDIRPGPTVDIVADMNEPLPIESESYDGIFSQFLLEHLRLPRVRPFLSEMHRILKPGGRALVITANLLEQAKILIEKEERLEWNDDLIYMVFGGAPDYPENYHRSSLSPNYAQKLFLEAGFKEVTLFEHPVAMRIWGKSTDMIVEAKKSLVRIKHQL